jgi:hypothetical protein
MKPASVLYLPPPAVAGKTNYGDPDALVKNLRAFPPHYPVVFYSEVAGWAEKVKGIGEFIHLPYDPMLVKKQAGAEKNRFSVANYVFFTGLIVANVRGFSHVIMLEADCRVGAKDWDKTMFDEHFAAEASRELPIIMSGTVVCHNPCVAGLLAARRWANFCEAENKKNPLVPVVTYGSKGASEKGDPCAFTNGALSIYNMDSMNSFWDLKGNISELSVKSSPWDVEVGIQAWNQSGMSVYDRIYNMKSIYSGFADVMTNEAQRMSWLKQGRIVAVHQIKSSAQP